MTVGSGGLLELSIKGFWELKDHGLKEDGTPNVQCVRGYELQIVENRQRIVFEEILDRAKIPVEPTEYLTRRIAEILALFLPAIDPGTR